MKVAYFECAAGISGDMILGTLVDGGVALGHLKSDLETLHIDGYQLEADRVQKQGVKGTKVNVNAREENHHRHLKDILHIINDSALPDKVKEKSIIIFSRLALAEARVHQTDVEKVHFHEVGAMDAIIDVVGSVCGLFRLGIEKVVASPLNTGSGWTQSVHGRIPVPAPATMALLHDVPKYENGIEKELVTPTGAAILTTICSEFGPMPRMTVRKTGHGAGSYDLAIPNVLKLTIGTSYRDEV